MAQIREISCYIVFLLYSRQTSSDWSSSGIQDCLFMHFVHWTKCICFLRTFSKQTHIHTTSKSMHPVPFQYRMIQISKWFHCKRMTFCSLTLQCDPPTNGATRETDRENYRCLQFRHMLILQMSFISIKQVFPGLHSLDINKWMMRLAWSFCVEY